MKLERVSPLTGKLNSMEIPLTEEEYWKAVLATVKGKLIQEAFPTLTPDQREFIKTGYTPDDWMAIFGEDGLDEDAPDRSEEHFAETRAEEKSSGDSVSRDDDHLIQKYDEDRDGYDPDINDVLS